jgi:DNA-binding transcriptional regulator PaaX
MPGKGVFDFSAYKSKKVKDLSSREITFLTLQILAAGAVITSAIAVPNIVQVYAALGIIEDPKERRRISETFRSIERRGYIKRGAHGYGLSPKGKKLLTEEEIWNMHPDIPKHWDKKWHAIVFDIPGKKEKARQALRARLQELEFNRYQNSIYVHRFSAQKELEAFTDFYGIREHVRFLVIEKLE